MLSSAVFAGMWLTVAVPADLRVWQILLGAVSMVGAVVSGWFPLGALVAVMATAAGWWLGVTADPFILASVGVLAYAERTGSRRFPWWLMVSSVALVVVTLLVGGPPDGSGFEDRMRGVLLSAIVVATAWVLGVRTRHARREAAARARADERLRLARDVHDVLSHSLGAIGVQAGIAAHVTDLGEPELRETLREVEAQARGSLRELTSLLRAERSGMLERGSTSLSLTGRLLETLDTAERSGLRVEQRCSENVDGLPAAIRATVHRIVQEAVTNTIRHARASSVRISVTVLDTTVRVSVSDDGIGVSNDAREGHGITGMRERAALVGGELSVESTPPGLTVRASLPFAAEGEKRGST